MSCTLRPARQHRVHCRPRLERLESRRLFAVLADLDLGGTAPGAIDASAGPVVSPAELVPGALNVVQTTPADGDVLTQSPTDLLIQFDQPFDPFSLGANDVLLEQVNSDGTTTPVDPSVYSEPSPPDTPTDTLDVTVNAPLSVGQYRIVLTGSTSSLATLQGDQPLATAGMDTTLADFTIAAAGPPTLGGPFQPAPGVSLSDAAVLPTPGSTPVVVSSSLDFSSPMGSAQLYQFTLTSSQPLWRLGAEVSAQRDGGTLDTSLVLLDAQGNVIATGDYGRHGAPNDPYLFSGLKPGTYYLGVSGASNIPGQPGGYDPVAGTPGTIVQDQPGGPFQLHVAADPATPTTLVHFQLDQADPLVPNPTGITLNFSGPLSTDSLRSSDTIDDDPQFQALQVVDQSGKVWPLWLSSYEETEGQLSLVFGQPLPEGHYSLIVPATQGATDLAGQTPLAAGEPAGVLATWDVTAHPTTSDPTDLGPLLNNVVAGINGSDSLAPNTQISYRFVVTMKALYSLTTQYSGGALTIQREGSDGLVTIDAGASGQSHLAEMSLDPGVYHLQFSSQGTEVTRLNWLLKVIPFNNNEILTNGLGQGPALQLLLASTSASDFATPTSPTPTATPMTTLTPTPSPTPTLTQTPGGSTGAPQTSTFAPATPAAPSPSGEGSSAGHAGSDTSATPTGTGTAGLLLTLGGTLVGGPSLQAEHVAAVGPGSANATALAANASGLLQGINYNSALGSSGSSRGEESTTPAGPDLAPTLDGAMVAETAPAETGPDDRALAINEWIGRVGPAMLDWVALPFRDTPTFEARTAEKPGVRGEPVASPERIAMVRDDSPTESSEGIDRADFAAPLGLVATVVGVTRLRRPFQKWFRRKGTAPVVNASTPRTYPRGPHARF